MGVLAISQVLPFPPVKPPSTGITTNALVLAPSFEEFEREQRGSVTLRAIESSQRTGARLRRRREDIRDVSDHRPETRRPANPRTERRADTPSGEYGLHIAADPYPERVQHSTPFVAQVIGQATGQAGALAETVLAEAALNAGVAAYDGAAARTESYFGAHAPVEFHA